MLWCNNFICINIWGFFMTDIQTTEPEKITAGDYVQWKIAGSECITPAGDECLASDSWVLTYALVSKSGKIEITAEASTDDHLVTLAKATTAEYKPDIYSWQSYVTKSDERYMIDSGRLEILPDFAQKSDAGFDSRSHVKRTLDALEATLEQRATKDQSATVIAGEVVGKMPIQRVLEFYNQYYSRYTQEQRAQQVANGKGHDAKILVRFTDE